LTACETLPESYYGQTLAVSPDTLVTAARFASVDVYRRDLDAWSLSQQIPLEGNAEVSSVTTDADRLAFFVKHTPSSGVPYGTVEVYRRGVDGSWSLEQQLVPDLVSATQQEESSNSGVVVLKGSRLVVGARRFNGGDGRVFVYTLSGSIWTQAQLIESVLIATNFDMNFGHSLALDGDTLVVSENPSSGNRSNLENGQVHVYTWNGTEFTLTQTITAPSPADLDHFGSGVALAGDYLAIVDADSGDDRTLRIYRRSGGLFSAIWTLAGADATGERGLAFDGERLAIGAPSFSVDGATNVGAVRVFQRQPDDTFIESTTWIPFDYAAGRQFGTQLAFAGGHLVATNSADASAPRDVYAVDP
jgi:hypothetical protein